MLEGLRFMDGARRAGLTSSPDFFRIKGGLIRRSSSSASSASLSDVLWPGDWNLLRGKSKKALASVLDLECEIFRAPADNGKLDEDCGKRSLSPLGSSRSCGPKRPSAILACLVSTVACLSGDPARCCSMILIAACSSAKFATSLTLPLLAVASSSLEVEGEAGGVISVETARRSLEEW